MKSCLSTFVLVILLLAGSMGFSQECADFGGRYSTGFRNPVTGASVVFNFVQTDCTAIAVGTYQLDATGNKTEEVMPLRMYVSEGHESACEVHHCRIFRINSRSLEFNESSSVSAEGLNCHYNRVQWTLKRNGIVQTYFVSDSTLRCKPHRTLLKFLPRI
jgi:hypothetical protein